MWVGVNEEVDRGQMCTYRWGESHTQANSSLSFLSRYRPYILYSQKAIHIFTKGHTYIFTNGHKYHIEKWHTRLKKVVEKAHFTFLSVKKKQALRTCNGETCMLALPKIYKDSQFYLSNL